MICSVCFGLPVLPALFRLCILCRVCCSPPHAPPPLSPCSCATARDRRKSEQEKRRKQEEEALAAAAAEGTEGEAAATPGQPPLAAAIARRQAVEAGPSSAAQQSNAVMAPQVGGRGWSVLGGDWLPRLLCPSHLPPCVLHSVLVPHAALGSKLPCHTLPSTPLLLLYLKQSLLSPLQVQVIDGRIVVNTASLTVQAQEQQVYTRIVTGVLCFFSF